MAGAHEGADADAARLARLCRQLRGRGCRVVLAAHSLGCRVALGACGHAEADGPARAATPSPSAEPPLLDAMLLLGAACDNDALAADGEFPLATVLAQCTSLTIVHAPDDPTLRELRGPPPRTSGAGGSRRRRSARRGSCRRVCCGCTTARSCRW